VDATLSRPIRILALVGLLVAVAGAGMLALNRSHASSPTALPSAAQLQAQHRASEAAKKASASHVAARPATRPAAHKAASARHKAAPAKPVTAAKPVAAAKPAVAPAKKPVAQAKPVASKPHVAHPPVLVASNGLPMSLVRALRLHRIVVVSLFDPQSTTDAISFAEARAGAADAGVGFLGVSVLDNAVAGPLTAALPGGQLLPEPGLLIYRRPGTLVQRIDGFVDRDAVAQAAVASVTATVR
jgi:hypothetical protein